MSYKFKIKYLYFPLLIFFTAILSGCIDEPVMPEKITINGKLYGLAWETNHYVSAGPYPIKPFNRNFEISAARPYDLYIYNLGTFQTLQKFQNVFASNVKIVEHFPLSYINTFFDEIKNFDVTIYFPALTERKIIATKFISNDIFEDAGDPWAHLNAGSDSHNINIYTPGKSQITGKIYYLEANVDSITGLFTSYDRFGIKDVTLFEGSNSPIYFTNEGISCNPPEYLMPVNISLPSEFYGEKMISLSSPSSFKGSDLSLSYAANENRYLIPVLPGNDFKIKILVVYLSSASFLDYGFMCSYVNPAEPANISYNQTFSLVSPANSETNVDDKTIFEISDNDNHAIYEYVISYWSSVLKLYTNKKKIQLFEFKTFYFEDFNNKPCYWYVVKFPNYNNIDEFLSQPYPLDDRYDYIELSKGRTFKTAP